MTLNIEGIKSNFNYLQDLAKDHNLIICLQEHWLWGYETNFFEKHFPLHTIFSRSHDDNDPIPNFKARRGQAGTAIMWPSSLNKFIHKLPDGNSRVMAIKIELENHTDLDIVDKILIENTCGNNLSTHVPVFCVLAAKIQSNNIKKSSNSGKKFKIEWDRADLNKYQGKLKETLQENQSPNLTSTELVGNLIYCLKKAEKFAIPSRIIKLNGPKLKVSAETKILLNISKQKHRIWDIGGRKRGLDDSFKQLKEAKYNARKMIRKERAMERENFLVN
ncbi:unnamed protein product [Mytilus edulis]|uniref:Endonuclease/exonuclease/phosphatase domain-containing protein n=1 Tax=Mytilus edulis TaxID=6550 RepID=A0A8S3SHA9_MYTED|nr:unnamed protein product [Mytilus edulis]